MSRLHGGAFFINWLSREMTINCYSKIMQNPPLVFDRTKPLYPLIQSFYASMYGILELAKEPTIDVTIPLKSTNGLTLSVDWESVISDYKKLNSSLPSLFETPLRTLLISAYEVSVQHYDPNDSVWRFFKHARNAAAHDGFFYLIIRNGVSPISGSKSAIWGTKEIQMFMNGDPLLIEADGKSPFLEPGDVLQLLKDIENKF
jgi:hypothetical protein